MIRVRLAAAGTRRLRHCGLGEETGAGDCRWMIFGDPYLAEELRPVMEGKAIRYVTGERWLLAMALRCMADVHRSAPAITIGKSRNGTRKTQSQLILTWFTKAT